MSIPNLEIGNVIRTKRIEVAYDGEGGLITANYSAGRGKRFIIAVLGTTKEGGKIDVDRLLGDLGWVKQTVNRDSAACPHPEDRIRARGSRRTCSDCGQMV